MLYYSTTLTESSSETTLINITKNGSKQFGELINVEVWEIIVIH